MKITRRYPASALLLQRTCRAYIAEVWRPFGCSVSETFNRPILPFVQLTQQTTTPCCCNEKPRRRVYSLVLATAYCGTPKTSALCILVLVSPALVPFPCNWNVPWQCTIRDNERSAGCFLKSTDRGLYFTSTRARSFCLKTFCSFN